MTEPQSNIGDQSPSFQSNAPNELPFEGIKQELHTIVDKLQRDDPSGKQPRRPLWQRVLIWAVPLWLLAFLLILSYNPRADNCNGVKITYRQKTLCIADEKDFFVFVENITCDFIERGNALNDSLKMDTTALATIENYRSVTIFVV